MFGHAIRHRFSLQDGIAFLNHGSFGATPLSVQAAQSAWRARMEQQPVRFFSHDLPGLLRETATQLGNFLHTPGENLALVENATSGVNAVLHHLPLAPGQEILHSAYCYPSVKRAIREKARLCGALAVETREPFPADSATLFAAWEEGIQAGRTALVVLEHVSSPTAQVHPVGELITLCRKRGIPVLVDGAHAPGMIPLDLTALDPDWYTGNGHKWLFAPKGCAFLWQSPRAYCQALPLVVAFQHDLGFPGSFDWTGTRDPSSWLSLPEALAFHREMSEGGLSAYQKELMLRAVAVLGEMWEMPLALSPCQTGSMATLPLPEVAMDEALLNDYLWREHGVEVPIFMIQGKKWVRISVQAYNELEDYQRLGRGVLAIP